MTLAILIVAPWLAVAAFYLLRATPAVAVIPAPAAAMGSTLPAGPWGRLIATPIVISPPLEYVGIESAAASRTQWFFPGLSTADVRSLLDRSGVPADQRDRLLATARPEPRIRGHVLVPPDDLIRALSPESRAALYSRLAASPLNDDHADSFRFFGDSVDVWLGSDLIAARTRELVAPLVYRHGGYLHFADMSLVGAQIDDDEEERRLHKVLHRQPTLQVNLQVGALADVPALVEYWGRGGRRTDIRPLLESVAGGGSIDIIHLLPTFGREYLYRFPKLTGADLERPVIANCLWTALNFFNRTPDDRYLDVGYALDRLKRDYYIVESGFELGDVIAFIDADDAVYHAAVYIAGGLVLTKNGTTPMAPWLLVPLDRVVGYYATRAPAPRLVYHRRKDF